jgi:hypothetical protein
MGLWKFTSALSGFNAGLAYQTTAWGSINSKFMTAGKYVNNNGKSNIGIMYAYSNVRMGLWSF